MKPESQIYVAGHTGLVGSAITRQLKRQGFTNLPARTIDELDLTDASATNRFFEEVRHGGETSAVGDDTGLSQLRRSIDRSGSLVGATPEGDEGDDRGV